MQQEYFAIRFSSRTFEHYSGMGYQDTGGSPEQFVPLSKASFGFFLSTAGYIHDNQGNVIGCRFKNCEDGTIIEAFPGKVYSISVWTTAVDDDGCPEDICIHYYLELILYDEAMFPQKN